MDGLPKRSRDCKSVEPPQKVPSRWEKVPRLWEKQQRAPIEKQELASMCFSMMFFLQDSGKVATFANDYGE
jgi:hypothetical protein